MPVPSRLRSTLLCLGVALGAAPGRASTAQAQATTGVIRGTITDSTGGARSAGAPVTLRNAETNAERVLTHERARGVRGHAAPGRHLRRDGPGAGVPGGEEDGAGAPAGRDAGPVPFALAPQAVQLQEITVAGVEPTIDVTTFGERHPARRRGGRGTAQQRPQHLQLHDAHAQRGHRAGPGRRRDQHRRPEAASTTTSRWTAPTSTIRSSASSAAASGRRSRSTSTRCRSSWSWPTAPTPSSGARAAASSTSSPSRAPTSSTARRTTSASTTRSRPTSATPSRTAARPASAPTSPSTSSAPRSAGRWCGTRRSSSCAYDQQEYNETKQTEPAGRDRPALAGVHGHRLRRRRCRANSGRSRAPTTPTPCWPSSTSG